MHSLGAKGDFEAKNYSLIRGQVEIAGMGSAVLTGSLLPDRSTAKVGYIYLPAFYRNAAAPGDEVTAVRSTSSDLRRILADFASRDGGTGTTEARDTTTVGGLTESDDDLLNRRRAVLTEDPAPVSGFDATVHDGDTA